MTNIFLLKLSLHLGILKENIQKEEAKMNVIDLHVHSNCSDGTLSPAELAAYALKKKLAAIALTDHDTIDGLEELFSAANGTGLEVISGIEFSTEFHGKDVHIVGLDFDYKQ